MTISPQYKYEHRVVVNAIHQPMFLGDTTTPTAFWLAFQWLWMARTCLGVGLQFFQQILNFCICLGLTLAKFNQPLDSLIGIFYRVFHQPTLLRKSSRDSLGSILWVLPCLYSSSPRSRLAKNSSLETSVGSDVFSLTSLRKYFTARFSKLSSSAIRLILRRSSAFSCTAVITLIL